jgi:predicted permease
MSPWVRLTTILHRRLARWFPHEFQMRHGDDLERLGEDAAADIWRRYGAFGLLRMLIDAAFRLIFEYWAELGFDLKHALRRLRRSPGFAVVGVLSLTFAVGMCSLFYNQISTMNAPAPGIGHPNTLVSTELPVSYPYFESYREQTRTVSAASAFIGPTPFTVRVGGPGSDRQRFFGHLVTPDYFATLEAVPLSGRFFDPVTERPGSGVTAVISHRFWQVQLSSDPKAVGRSIEVNGHDAVIVGIAARGFRGVYPLTPADIYLPITVGPAVAPDLRGDAMQDASSRRFRPLLRHADGVTMAGAEAALQVTTKNLDEQRPESERPRERRTLRLLEAGVMSPITPEGRKTVYGLNMILLGTILAMACSNLAVLLLARSGDRRKEMAIRLSAGAGRFRIVREWMTECVLIALAGGGGGLALAYWLLRLTGSLKIQSAVPVELNFHLDWPSALFALGVSVLAGLGFGLAPALASVRGDLFPALKDGPQTLTRGRRWFGIRNQFMTFQLAGSLMLLLLTGYIVWGYQKAYSIDPGFNTDGIYLLALDPARDGYSIEESTALLEDVPEALAGVGGIRSASLSLDVPFTRAAVVPDTAVTVPSAPAATKDATLQPAVVNNVVRQRIGAGYFETLGIPILQGREFRVLDQTVSEEGRPVPIVLNQTAAQRLFGNADAIGATVRAGDQSHVVIGIVRDIRCGLMMGAPAPTMFTPLTGAAIGAGSLEGATLLLRGLPGGAPLEEARRALAALDPEPMVFNTRSLNDDLEQFNVMIRWSAMMNGSLGVFGLILSVVGLFGVTAHAVARRRKEIGIRVSLGAQRNHVLGLVLKEGAILVLTGGALGFGGAYLLSHVFSASASRLAEVFAVGTDDPLLVFGAPLAWAALAMVACFLPARRSVQIDPISTLRTD